MLALLDGGSAAADPDGTPSTRPVSELLRNTRIWPVWSSAVAMMAPSAEDPEMTLLMTEGSHLIGLVGDEVVALVVETV